MHAPVVGSHLIPGSQCSQPPGFLASLPGTHSQPSQTSVPLQSVVFWHRHTLQGNLMFLKSVGFQNGLKNLPLMHTG